MNYLLDTHILLWWRMDAPELGSKVRRIIEKEPVWVSTAVVWEMLIKKGIGKLKIPGNVDQQLKDEGFHILDIKLDHVMALEKLEHHHADPFDRIQIAQAKTERFTFITKDKAIQKYSGLDILSSPG